jgi:toxin HigB-1
MYKSGHNDNLGSLPLTPQFNVLYRIPRCGIMPVIETFGDKKTEALFRDERVLDFQSFARSAKRKLDMLHAAAKLEDLRVPPSNRLEKLEGNLKGFHSMRINDQWRLIFRWIDGNAHDVQIVDYH